MCSHFTTTADTGERSRESSDDKDVCSANRVSLANHLSSH